MKKLKDDVVCMTVLVLWGGIAVVLILLKIFL